MYEASIEVDIERAEPPTLTKDIIAETDCLDTLNEWFGLLRASEMELGTLISAQKMSGEGSTFGMARKLGYIRIAMNWTRERILELGGELEDNQISAAIKTLKHHLTMAQQQLEKKKKTIKQLRAENEKLRANHQKG